MAAAFRVDRDRPIPSSPKSMEFLIISTDFLDARLGKSGRRGGETLAGCFRCTLLYVARNLLISETYAARSVAGRFRNSFANVSYRSCRDSSLAALC